MSDTTYITKGDPATRKSYRAWTRGVQWEAGAEEQVKRLLALDFVKNVMVMPDTHFGKGGPVGVAVEFSRAVCPAVVGVDIGCGMSASLLTNIHADMLTPEVLPQLRQALEENIPHGLTRGVDRGSWRGAPPPLNEFMWTNCLSDSYQSLCARFSTEYNRVPRELALSSLSSGNTAEHKAPHLQLGTLGSGNHFFEISTDQHDRVWLVVHSGSRGPGARIGDYFTRRAQELMRQWHVRLPTMKYYRPDGTLDHETEDQNLAYLPVETPEFQGYVDFVQWAQKYAYYNRNLMTWTAIHRALAKVFKIDPCVDHAESFDIHHNWLECLGSGSLIARKGAVKLLPGDRSIIPGAMGARTYIVKGLPGLHKSLLTCSHGAGRAMSRTQATKTIPLEQHQRDMATLECDRSAETLDETKSAYKDIDAVIAAQADLVEPVYVLNAKVCMKGISDIRRK